MENFRHYTRNNEGSVTFTFYKAFTIEGNQYLVIASDFNSQFQLFYMQEEQKEGWKIVQPEKVFDWIFQLEDELSRAIVKHQEKQIFNAG